MTKWDTLLIGCIVIALLLLWAAVTEKGYVPEYILPSPRAVLKVISIHRHELAWATISTTFTALVGFCVAIVFGLATGLLLYRLPLLKRVVMPCLISLKSTPIIALVPIASLILDVGFAAKLFFAFVVCFFPMVLSAYAGLENVPEDLRDFSASLAKSRERYFFLISLPSAANELMLGMRITLPLAFVGAVVAEMAGGDDSGLGYVIISASYRMDTPALYAGVVLLMLISSTTFFIVSTLAAHLNPLFREGRVE